LIFLTEIEEKERKVREEKEATEREYNEKMAKLNEQTRKQRERDEEMERKLAGNREPGPEMDKRPPVGIDRDRGWLMAFIT
jgi:ribosomal protein L32E